MWLATPKIYCFEEVILDSQYCEGIVERFLVQILIVDHLIYSNDNPIALMYTLHKINITIIPLQLGKHKVYLTLKLLFYFNLSDHV